MFVQRQAAPAFGIAITTTVLAMSKPVGGLGPGSGGLGLGAWLGILAAALLFVPAILFSLRVRADDAAAEHDRLGRTDDMTHFAADRMLSGSWV